MIILGIGGILGDAATAILKDGEIAAAVEESKLVRRRTRRDSNGDLPVHSIQACLDLARVRAGEVEIVAVVRPVPGADFHLKLRAFFPNSRVAIFGHHLAHAAAAYYPSPFDQATVLTLDRRGDLRCGARWQASGARMTMDIEQYAPDSIGAVYGRVAELLGFEQDSEEHKAQWLSVHGDERFKELFLEILSLTPAGPRPDFSFFSAERLRNGGFGRRFYERIGVADGAPVPEALRAHIAAGMQKALEDAVIRMAGEGRNLCLAGGLGLNALLVSALETRSGFENVFAQPVAGNAGSAIGALLAAWHLTAGQEKRIALKTLCLGPSYSANEIKQDLENCKLRFRYLLTDDELIDAAVSQLNDHRIVAWMHGRMEFGARALGNRSILASPLDPYSTENLNVFIKHREPFRKFAVSVPAELASQYFQAGWNSRFLSTVGRVLPAHRETFGAAALAQDLVRVHTVDREENPLYWKLLHAAGKATGLPALYNTSFNLFGEPLVCSPRDAVRSFYSSGIDAMFVGHFFLQK